MDSPTEIWKVDVDGSIYEADADTLRQWILDGYLTPQTKVQKGSLKWIELGRVPAYRGLFGGDSSGTTAPEPAASSSGSWGSSEPAAPSSGGWGLPESVGPSTSSWGRPETGHAGFAPSEPSFSYAPPSPGAAPGNTCVSHPSAVAKYVCEGCHASLCVACVKRYGNAAVCGLCGGLARPMADAIVKTKREAELASGFGFGDFALAIQYPFKDPIALVFTAILYGFLLLFQFYGKAAAGAILFGYMSHAIRRVSMGHYEEGPTPDFSDLSDLVFEAGKLGLAVMIITYGPLISVAFITLGELSVGDLDSLTTLGVGAIGIVLALIWAALYYPMALLVAGYTHSFVSTINPVIGIMTAARLGFDYVKAYLMFLVVFGLQVAFTTMLTGISGAVEGSSSKIFEAGVYLVQSILQGAVVFVASMVIAALLGLMLFKRQDVVDVDV